MSQEGLQARKAAVRLLNGVLGEGRALADLLRGPILERLSPEERARAQRLATETLRRMEQADRLLKPHLRKPPPTGVRNILRLAVVELAQGGADHGVVNAAVTIAAHGKRTGHFRGLVNAVLRKIAATEDGDSAPEVDVSPLAAEMARLRSPRLPRWLRDPLKEAWGAPAVAAMEAAHLAGAPLDLTAKGDAEELARATGGELLPTGSVRLSDPGRISALPGYDEGAFWVQDAAAALPVRMLRLTPGERVLDLCAAPGGKTLQAAAAGADVTAVDISEPRIARITENLARTGLTAELVVGDALEQAGQYDAIILDAPCSATGTIRRHPDLPHARQGEAISGLIALQAEMIDHALTLLAPVGRMVFCTCSLLPDEGEVQVEEALARHPGLRVDPAARDLPGVAPEWHSAEGGLRLRPDVWAERGGMDGFYMAVLVKTA
ncbi:RsmB/NOP family class I SAM-dependent RNA methyltransferase [Poseidonocella sedimentorum]|uniref:16S rRNA (Cytosine967-C5)-methyltransferase n=1 Tax=Poseidonocella sedimentorum TaxID=871652 RepID=A0A1I6E975_9RHOB|nr:transcription antitermination factor NusB [Poseidonocella sedimentorum]SFR14197.1 16S rRNA (cytosine967-C5)-methyltransferase [Poseidonocella sedimentorum]